MSLDPDVAGQITALGINVRENFTITKRQGAGKNAPVSGEIARVAGEQPNGTLAVPRDPEAPAAPKPPATMRNAIKVHEREAHSAAAEG